MSGIAGIVHFRGAPPDRDQVHQLSAGVAHRGSDDKALVYAPPAAFAHRTFAVQGSGTPARLEDERLVVLVDGEADSHRIGRDWPTRGALCLPHQSGGFATAVWDRMENALWLARDPCGTRPLFYARDGDKFAFSSCMRALLGIPWISAEIAIDNLAEYLSFRYTHAPRTLVRDIHAVPPGHAVRIDGDGVRTERWWNPHWWTPGEQRPDFQHLVDRVDSALRRSVDRCTQTTQPMGLLLSGGLDSAAILHHATDLLGAAPPTFTVTMAGDKTDESAFAARVAETYGANHALIRITNEDLVASVDTASLQMGQPLPSPAALVQQCLFQSIGSTVRILLSGVGGDEALGGRTMPQIASRLRRSRTVGRLPGPARTLGRTLARSAGFSDLAAPAAYFGLERKIGGSRVFAAEDRVQLLRDPAIARPGIRSSILEPYYQEVSSDPINEILHVWQRGWLTEDTLARTDRMASHNGIHISYPMLDANFLAVTAAMPGPEKCRRSGLGFTSKAPLRQAMQGRIPDRLLHRPKRAEPRPMAQWLRGPGAEFLRARIASTTDRCGDLFMADTIQTMASEHLNGEVDHSLQLWNLVMFDAWRASLL
ncbi:MAG: asparagine synthetase B [Myxococcota bacterium]|nr:asparagine synthetase B [Myxococcota bacterium]